MGIALGLGVSVSQAALTPLGGEFALLGGIKGHQQNPHVALGSTGGFVVWQTTTESDSTERVMVQRLGGDMTGQGVAARVSRSTKSWNELNPRVTMLANGGAAVVWIGGPRSGTDIYIRFLDAGGNYLGMPTLVNTFQDGIQSAPRLVTLSTGDIVVVWTSLDQDAEGEGVFGQIFTAAGARIGGEFRVNQSEASNQSDAALGALDDGRFVVAWVNEAVAGVTISGAQNLRGNLMGRIFDSQGRALGGEYQLNGGPAVGFSPALTVNSDGGFTLAWVQRDEENMRNLSDVYVRTFNNAGMPLTDDQRHNTWLRGQQLAPELMQLGNETLVVWTSYGQDDSGGGIQGRLLSGGREFQVNSQGRLHQRAPTIAADGANKFLAVWVNTISPTHSILSAQRYVNSDSDLGGVVDVTAGEVEVVAATETRRRATPVPQDGQSEPVLTESTIGVAALPAEPVAAVDKTAVEPVQVQPVSESAATSLRSSEAGRNVLLATARQRTLNTRTRMTRPATTLAQSRAGQLPSSSRSFAQRMTGLRPATTRSSVASRQSPQPSYQRASGWRTGLASSRASRSTLTQTSRRTFTSASSRFNTIMRNSLSRTGTTRQTRAQPKPVSTSLQRTDGGGHRIQWTSRKGARYQVQGSRDLSQWANVGAVRGGLGSRDSMQVNQTDEGPRYYRVVQVN